MVGTLREPRIRQAGLAGLPTLVVTMRIERSISGPLNRHSSFGSMRASIRFYLARDFTSGISDELRSLAIPWLAVSMPVRSLG